MPSTPTPTEIREAYADFQNEWRPIQQEGKVDMRYVAGDPWEPKDRRAREDAGRPCISLDEIGQFLNQTINNVRQNKRDIQITPTGDGAEDKEANRIANMIRGIEYRSNAETVHVTAFENAINRSYGWSRITTQYVDEDSFDQEVRLKRIKNPDLVLPNPDYDEADGSDMKELFVLDILSKKEFKQKYPKAKITNFTDEMMVSAPGWVRDQSVMTAEFWKRHQEFKKLLMIRTKVGTFTISEDDLQRMKRGGDGRFRKALDGIEIVRERRVECFRVVQYLTNGLEVIDTKPWAGSRIPIVGCFGKELFLDEGAGPKRVLMSMVRLARDPQMLLAYNVSCQAETTGRIPKMPFVGAKGQFESDSETWEEITKVPHAYAQYDAKTDATGEEVLPPPTYQETTPHFTEFIAAQDSISRSVQKAMGISPLPTAALRANEKSGIAIEKMQTQEAIGAFHFTDNLDRYLHNIGFQYLELLPKIYVGARDVPVETADGKRSVMRLNDKAYEVQNPEDDHLHLVDDDGQQVGQYGVTISTGPSYQSEREQVSSFVDMLITNLANLPVQPEIGAKILAMAIRMKDMGAMGSKLADLIDPPDPDDLSPAAQAAITQLKAQMSQLAEENQALYMEKAGKYQELQSKAEIEQMKSHTAIMQKQWDYITRVVVAEMAKGSKASEIQANLNAQKELTLLGFRQDKDLSQHQSAHELAMLASQPQPEAQPAPAAQ